MRHLDTDTFEPQLTPHASRDLAHTHMRKLAALAGFGFAVASAAGLARVIRSGLAINNDDDAWAHVRQHEQRFLQALRQGSAAEGDDASC